MKVVSLVSGGKDSCYNMLVCEQYGHQVVALGNLLPEALETDDLDSYMYQTVGHQVIAAYAQCMGLPLFRRRISGSSRQQQLVYEDTEGDEVEDLYCLLAYIKERMPEVQAVASGAIASDYQRTRVERVCARLGLVSLAYLWQQPQAPLLRRMIDSHIDAILVKIAAAGLTPGRHLGATLASLPQQLAKLRRIYGINVCGEGGEYESLTLDCPLFRCGRIVLDGWEKVIVSGDSMAPVALLHPTAFHVELKGEKGAGGAEAGGDKPQESQQQGRQQQQEQQQGQEGSGGGEGLAAANGEVIEVPADYAPAPPAQPAAAAAAAASLSTDASAGSSSSDCSSSQVQLRSTAGSEYLSLTAEVTHRALHSLGEAGEAGPAATAAALSAALAAVQGALPALGLSWHSALFVHLYIPSMAHFGAANEAYSRFFPPINPPSRATVEIGANAELALVVEVLFARRPEGRRVLHVQSISEWAPSCIGPYSQALAHRGLVLMAGQIPLDPPTMAMVPGGLEEQCVRALRSCQAVAVAMKTDLPRSMLWCTVYCSGTAGAEIAARHMEAFLGGAPVGTQAADSSGDGSSGGEDAGSSASSDAGSDDYFGLRGGNYDDGLDAELDLDEYLVPPPTARHWQPLMTYVMMPELPRGALVEIQPVACLVDDSIDAAPSSSSDSSSSDDDESPGSDATGSAAAGAGEAASQQQRSSMPGWIGRLEEREVTAAVPIGSDVGMLSRHSTSSPAGTQAAAAAAQALSALQVAEAEASAAPAVVTLRCRWLSSPGRLCRVCIELSAAAPETQAATPSSSSGALGAASGESAAAWQLAVAEQLLGALRHAELAPADVAALKVYCPGEGAVQAGAALRGLLVDQLGGGVQATLVPAVAVGCGAGVGALLVVELLAVQHRRQEEQQ